MPVVAVVNRKGGSGKSTLATNLAGYCANEGRRVMLGDVDHQQSSLAWLRRRAEQPLASGPAIVGWGVDPRSVMRPPAGITHVVLDTQGGLRGFDLTRVVMSVDAIVMPVCDSMFDRESAIECYAELMTLPRIASGRCKVAMVGMRVDARTKGADRLAAWAAEHGFPYLGSVRETQLYVRNAEQGLTLFDAPSAKVEADMAQWQPIVDWLEATWKVADRLRAQEKATIPPNQSTAPQSAVLQPRSRAIASASVPRPPATAKESRLPVEVAPSRSGPRFGWLFSVFRSLT
jgi:chromosome partitioning protein